MFTRNDEIFELPLFGRVLLMKTGARKKNKQRTTESEYFARFEHEIYNSNKQRIIHMHPKVQRPNKDMLDNRPNGDYFVDADTKTVLIIRGAENV